MKPWSVPYYLPLLFAGVEGDVLAPDDAAGDVGPLVELSGGEVEFGDECGEGFAVGAGDGFFYVPQEGFGEFGLLGGAEGGAELDALGGGEAGGVLVKKCALLAIDSEAAFRVVRESGDEGGLAGFAEGGLAQSLLFQPGVHEEGGGAGAQFGGQEVEGVALPYRGEQAQLGGGAEQGRGGGGEGRAGGGRGEVGGGGAAGGGCGDVAAGLVDERAGEVKMRDRCRLAAYPLGVQDQDEQEGEEAAHGAGWVIVVDDQGSGWWAKIGALFKPDLNFCKNQQLKGCVPFSRPKNHRMGKYRFVVSGHTLVSPDCPPVTMLSERCRWRLVTNKDQWGQTRLIFKDQWGQTRLILNCSDFLSPPLASGSTRLSNCF